MKLVLDGETYYLDFEHENDNIASVKGTYATLTDNKGNELFEEFACLHPNDQFNKRIGRKVAFARLLNIWVPYPKNTGEMYFGPEGSIQRMNQRVKEKRTNIWKQYFSYVSKK